MNEGPPLALALLPGHDASGHWAGQFISGCLGGWTFYYGAIATVDRATLRLLDQLARQLMRRCAGLRPDHPSKSLHRPMCVDGIFPATTLYAAAIVHHNLRHIATEWMEGCRSRLDLLRDEHGWPAHSHACFSTAPVLQRSSVGGRLLWAMRELGLMLVQADLPKPTEIPVAYPGEAHLELLPAHPQTRPQEYGANTSGFSHCHSPESPAPYYSGFQNTFHAEYPAGEQTGIMLPNTQIFIFQHLR